MMKLFVAGLILLMPLFGQEESSTPSKVFLGESAQVRLYEDDYGLFALLRSHHDGDQAQIFVFYHQTVNIGGKPVELLRAKSTMCPMSILRQFDADSGCDYIQGVKVTDVAWVNVRFFKTLGEAEIGRPKETAKK